ncbi:InlB B-repeat-containing protein [Raoultibacter phocaeensis]|uniref:InlB B-repeat-containing protein n=1 Tax=Raoultibacter phocaeensis TaxID=2479841 RepID=UPI0015D60DD6|nr:InlB B-repeat-containing protein [Raoultibacter phocaeensis]
MAIYCPFEESGEYPWNPGLVASGNHVMPYGLALSGDPLVLEVGQEADLFEGGVREAPEGMDLSYSYSATVMSVDAGTVTGKKAGTADVSVTLEMDGEVLARASRTVEVAKAAADEDGEQPESLAPPISSLKAEPLNFTAPLSGKANEGEEPTPYASSYSITYDLNGGMFLSGNQNPTSYSMSSSDVTVQYSPVKPDCEFLGWTGSNGTVPQKTVTIPAFSAGDRTYKANWASRYTIAFDANGGTGKMSSMYMTEGTAQNLTANSFTRSGYSFAGWATSSSGSAQYGNGALVDIRPPGPGVTIYLYAKWALSPSPAFKITYDLDGGMYSMGNPNPPSYTMSSSDITFSGGPVKPNCTFLGWTGSNGTVPQKTVTIPAFSAGDRTYKANWARNYTIAFNANGGTGSMASMAMVEGTAKNLTANNFSRSGYNFAGWATYTSGSAQYADRALVDIHPPEAGATITLYAKWVPVPGYTFTITYNLNSGTYPSGNPNPATYTYESADIVLQPPTRANCTFVGWTGSNGSTPQTSVTIPKGSDGDRSYFANWKANYTIAFNANGGTGTMASMSMVHGTAKNLTANGFTRTGYAFAGWATSADGSVAYSDKQSVNNLTTTAGSTVTLYAKWTPVTYTIEYDLGDGTATGNPGAYTIESAAIALKAPTKANCTFAGWTGSNGTTPQTSVTIPAGSTGDKSYTANWKANYTITFNANGGTGSMTSMSMVEGTAKNLTANGFTRSGYTFAGWATSSAGAVVHSNGASVNNLSTVPGATVTLYAKWTPVAYAIEYDLGDGTASGNPTSYTVESAAITLKAPTKANHTFLGWTGSNGTTPQTSVTIPAGSTGDKSYTANWANNYSIAFNANGGTGTTASMSMVHGTAKNLTANSFTRSGYAFAGWATSADGSVTYADKQSVNNLTTTAGSTVTLYAKWTPVTYTIEYDLGDGTATGNPGAYTIESAAIALKAPTRANHVFVGWTGSNGTTPQTSVTIPAGSTGDKSYTANWKSTYTIQFDANGGTGSTAPMSMVYGTAKTLTPNGFTRTGHTFTGWKDDAGRTYTDKQSVNELTAVAGATVMLRAQWSANSYALEYVSDGATQKTATVPYGSLLADSYAPPSVSKKGHTFQSWNQPDGSAWNFSSGTMPADALTLTASWKANTYTVAFHANGGSGTGMADQGMTYGVAANLSQCGYSRTGYTFLGWSTDPSATTATYANGAQVRDLSEVQGAKVTLYAVWEANPYTVVFHANHPGDSSTSTQSFRYNETTKTLSPNAFARTGWTFDKWNTAADGTGTNYADKALVSSPLATSGQFHLYAQWTQNEYSVAFDSNGGSDVEGQTVGYGELVADPGAPARAGYTFGGWYASSSFAGSAWNFASDTVPVDGVTLHAKWTANCFTVTLDPGAGAGILTSRSYTYEAAGQNLPAVAELGFSKTGYAFAGWTVAADGSGTVFADGAGVATGLSTGAPVTLHAQWSANSYTVKFDAGAGSLGEVPAQMAATFDQDVTLPSAEPSRKGYAFLGWSETAGATAAEYSAGQTLTTPNFTSDPGGTATLHAVWQANTYTVKFDPNATADQGLTGGSMSDQTFTYDADPQALAANAYERTGYTFKGWAENADGTGTLRPDKDPVKNLAESGTVTLYAKWEANTYFAFFFPNAPEGATVSTTGSMTQTFTYDTKANLAPTPFSCSGYEFAGWNTKADGSGDSFADGAEVLNLVSTTSAFSLYAQWRGSAYTVKFDKNAADATGAMDDLELNWGVRADLPAGSFKRDGWAFSGWNTAADGSGSAYADGANVRDLPQAGQNEVTLYAQWTPVISVAAPVKPVLKVTADGETGALTSAGLTDAAFASRTPVKLRIASMTCDPDEAGAPLAFPDRASWPNVAVSMDALDGNSVRIALGNDLIFGSRPSFVIGASSDDGPGTLPVQFGLTAGAGTPVTLLDEAVPLAHLTYTFEPIKETL